MNAVDLLENKVKIGNSMRKNIEYHYDTKNKKFYTQKSGNGVEFIELNTQTMIGLLTNLKQKRDRLEWTKDGINLFPELAPSQGKIGRKRIAKGESKMMKNEIKTMIKEELLKVLSERLLTEKFESKTLSKLAKEKDFRSKFFTAAANTYNIAWDQVPESAVTMNKPSGNGDVINFFFVKTRKTNPFSGNSYETIIFPGLIGSTKGKKHIYTHSPSWKSSDKPGIRGATKSSQRMGAQTAGVHNFKRYSEVADVVYSIDVSKLTGATTDKKADRAAAKAGATALISAKAIASQNRQRYEKLLTQRLANSSPGDQVFKIVDAMTKMYKSSVDKQVAMLKKKKISDGWNTSSTLINRAQTDIMRAFERYLSAENAVVKGAEKDSMTAQKAKKLKAGDKASWSEEKYYQKELIRYAREIQTEFKKLKTALKKVDASKEYRDIY